MHHIPEENSTISIRKILLNREEGVELMIITRLNERGAKEFQILHDEGRQRQSLASYYRDLTGQEFYKYDLKSLMILSRQHQRWRYINKFVRFIDAFRAEKLKSLFFGAIVFSLLLTVAVDEPLLFSWGDNASTVLKSHRIHP